MGDLSNYLTFAARRPLLDATAERRLGRAIGRGREASLRIAAGVGTAADHQAVRAGDDARAELVESNLRLVVSVARRFPTHTLVELSDLIQAGNHGLLTAADRFDPDRGFRFSTYATTWIRSSIGRTLDTSTAALHVPIRDVNALRIAMRATAETGQDLPRDLAPLHRAYEAVSLDLPVEGLPTTLGDLQASAESVEDAVEERLEHQYAHTLLRDLPGLHRRALETHFGFPDGQPRSNRFVAAALGVSARRSRRLVDEGLQMLRARASGPTATTC